jgi:hypothetical protein
VYALWQASQDLGRVSGTKDEIVDWAQIYEDTPEMQAKWLRGLERNRFISLLPDGAYRIHGNETELTAIAKRKERGKKGGQTRWHPEASTNDASSMPEACSEQDASMLGATTALHGTALHSTSLQSTEEDRSSPSSKPGRDPEPERGPLPLFFSEKYLKDLSDGGKRKLIENFGLELITAEIEKINLAWAFELEANRNPNEFAVYLRRWLENAKASPRAGPRVGESVDYSKYSKANGKGVR